MYFNSLTIYYSASFGKCDGGETCEWDIDLDEAQSEAFKKAVMTRTPLDEVPELDKILDQAYDEILEMETECLLECNDEYAMECLGEADVDPDELNTLVRSGDSHAIQFLGLQEMSAEELEKWDANSLDELPKIKEFREGFVPYSPYEKGYSLNFDIQDVCDIEIEEDELYEYIRSLFTNGDIGTVEEVVSAQENEFYGCAKKAFEIARETGCTAYTDKYKEDFEDEDEEENGMRSISFEVQITVSGPYYSTECDYSICLSEEDCDAIESSSSWDELPEELYSRVYDKLVSEIESDLRDDGTLDDDEDVSDRFDIYIVHPNAENEDWEESDSDTYDI